MIKRLLAVTLSLCFILTAFTGIVNAQELSRSLKTREFARKSNMTQVRDLGRDSEVTIMVELSGDAALKAAGQVKGASKYQTKLLNEQAKVEKKVEITLNEDINVEHNYTLLFNGFSFKGNVSMLEKLNKIEGITAFVAPVFELPKTVASAELINAPAIWDLGYTGEGTAIAIVDTGIRETHEAFSVMPEGAKFDREMLEDIYEEYGEFMHSGSNINRLYYTEKIPFEYDYVQNRYGAEHISGDHGSHVAGIAAGNNGKDFKGIAYDAQIFAMQVFSAEGGAPWDKIILALEDCVYLGVDSINMSLGSACGSSEYYEETHAAIFEQLIDAGIAISASAGNEGSTAIDNAWSGYQLAQNPDSGVVSSPSTFPASLSVASSENATVCAGSIIVSGKQYSYNDPYADTSLALNEIPGDYEFVDCGFGKTEELEGMDLTGKIALISRGDISFTEKANNVDALGAVAAVIYNNQPGVFGMVIDAPIPTVAVPKATGEEMLATAKNGVGNMTIKDETFIDYSTANVISSFSSRGTTTELHIKPEITAPGGAITSSVGLAGDTAYDTWNGTSMSAPHVAAGLAVVKQYVEEVYPKLNDREQLQVAYAIIMSTATQLNGELVRSQGAGLMNLAAAVSTNAYLTDVNGNRPKLELGEDDDNKLEMEFKATNMGDKAITYDISTNVLIDTPYVYATYEDKPIYVTDFTALDVTEDCNIKANKSVTIQAGKTTTIKVTVELGEELAADLKEIFTNGAFIEGFITLTPRANAEGAVDATLSIPYLAFEGDWSEPAIIDYGYYWQDAQGDANWYSNSYLPYNYIGSSKNADTLAYGAGINPYGDGTMPENSFSYDRISVNNPEQLNYMAFSLLRNPKILTLDVKNYRGDVLYNLYTSEEDQWKKEFSDSTYSYSDLAFELNIDDMMENQTHYIELMTILGYDGYHQLANDNGNWVVPFTKDTTAPYMLNFNYKNDKLTVEAFDTMYVANIAVYKDAKCKELLANQLYYSNSRGQQEKFVTELKAEEIEFAYIMLCDYAGNERLYTFNLLTGTMTEDLGLMSKTELVGIWADSFEDEATYDSWDTIDANGDGDEWGIAEAAEYASHGTTFAYSYSYDVNTDTAITPDNWIISPAVEIPDDGKAYVLSFDIAASEYDEYFELYYGDEEAIEVEDFTSLGGMTLSGDQYETITVDLSELAGETVRFAWRHYNCTDGNFLRLDNIIVGYEQPASEGELVYEQGFETNTPKWTSCDADGDGNEFTRVKNENLASSGKYAMFSASFDTAKWQSIDADNWIISNKLNVPKAPNASYLNFDVISVNNAGDYYEVYIGTTDKVKEMTKIYSATATGDWTRQHIDVSEYAGKAVYVAIRHLCNDGMLLGIDNVTLSSFELETEYTVRFVDKNNKLVAMLRCTEGSVIEGLPMGRDTDKLAFGHWDYDGAKITKDITIKGVYYEWGDANLDGVMNTGDATAVLCFAADLREFTDEQYHVADMNRDGKVNTGDAVVMLKYIASH